MSAERLTGFCPGDDYPTAEDLADVADAIGAVPVGEWTVEWVPALFYATAPWWRRWFLRQQTVPTGQSGWICSVMAERVERVDG